MYPSRLSGVARLIEAFLELNYDVVQRCRAHCGQQQKKIFSANVT